MKNSIIDEAVSLPSDKRAELVDILMQSLNPKQSEEIDAVWIREAEKRYNEIKGGTSQGIDAADVFDSIRERLAK